MKSDSGKFSTKKLAQAALVAALSFVGYMIGIPVSATGTEIHLGNAVVVLGAFLLGGPLGGLSGAVGLSLADLLKGFATSAPKTFFLKLIIGLVAGFVSDKLMHIKERDAKEQLKVALVSSAVALGVNTILDPVTGYFYKMYILGIPQDVATIWSKISSVATLVNSVVCVIVVTFVWPLLYKGLKRAGLLAW
ncbi:MAG: ECF transporter S component [Lachnospiraceae bacterium]|nr:ECF transporter S component [Lachnospiraceae bacterium]